MDYRAPDAAIFDVLPLMFCHLAVALTGLVGTSERTKGVDYATESLHNMKEALPELWEEAGKDEGVRNSRNRDIGDCVKSSLNVFPWRTPRNGTFFRARFCSLHCHCVLPQSTTANQDEISCCNPP